MTIGRLLRSGCLAVVIAATAAHAQGLGVATWNLGWLLDAATHARWTATCARHGWPTDTAALPAQARAAFASLPYCNVHNGMRFPAASCRSDRDGWPRAARYPAEHPCRDTADLATWSAYERKLAALRAMFAQLDREGVRLVALQEVVRYGCRRRDPAARLARRDHRASCRTRPRLRSMSASRGRTMWKCATVEAVNALADSGLPERPLRPGLAFTVDVRGLPVRVLVVHLKAGCRNRTIDAPLTAADARLPADRQDAIASDCAMLRYQMPALESWIDAHAGTAFAVMGDFNRSLLREAPFDGDAYRVRLDGSRASDPLGPCTMRRDHGRAIVACAAMTRALFAEINDDTPKGAVLWRSTFADLGRGGTIKKNSSGDCRIMGRHGELTHDGIDHVLISEALKRRLAPALAHDASAQLPRRHRRRARGEPLPRAAVRPLSARGALDARAVGRRTVAAVPHGCRPWRQHARYATLRLLRQRARHRLPRS